MSGVVSLWSIAGSRLRSLRPSWLKLTALLAVCFWTLKWLRSSRAIETPPIRSSRRDAESGSYRMASAGNGASHGSFRERKGGGRGKGGGKGAPRLPDDFPAYEGPATEAELGQAWHLNGARRWAWLHDGREANGWIELGQGGALRTSYGGGGRGTVFQLDNCYGQSHQKYQTTVTFDAQQSCTLIVNTSAQGTRERERRGKTKIYIARISRIMQK